MNGGMKMKRIAIILAVLAVLASTQAFALRPRLILSGFEVEGATDVGKEFTVALLITDVESVCADSLTVSVQASPPLTVHGVSSVETGSVCQNETRVVRVPLSIESSATGGTYPLTVTLDYETERQIQYSDTSTITIPVSGTPDIQATIAGSEPVDVYAGDTATVMVNLVNDGTYVAQSVSTTLEAESPLSVKWSKSHAVLGQLNPRQSASAEFAVEVAKEAPAKSYPMRLSVEYLDEARERKTEQFTLIFEVSKKAEFDTTDAGSDRLYPNENGNLMSVMLKNSGSDVAKKIKAKLQPQFPFSTDGSIRYIDSLGPGESVPVQFVVDIDKEGTPGAYGLDLILDYEDAQGKSLHDTAKASLSIEKKPLTKAVFGDYWYLWAIGVVAGLLILRRKLLKK
jgi:hypothetical protein